MKRKSPICVGGIRFSIYEDGRDDLSADIEQIHFDDRTDFLTDGRIGGLAVRIEINSTRSDSGVRRDVALTLVDMTARCEVASQRIKVNMRRYDYFLDAFAVFPSEGLTPGHTYRLVAGDAGAGQLLGERVFRLLDKDSLPPAAEWYEVCGGGVRPAWGDGLYRTVSTVDGRDYYVRFNVARKLGYLLSDVMPELELRLHYPDDIEVLSLFREPRCLSEENYEDNRWFVEFPFTTSYDRTGVLYAELLCMGVPVAGFAFDTTADDERGEWYGRYIEPLEAYTPEAAMEKWRNRPLCVENVGPEEEEDDFDKMLQSFINESTASADSEAVAEETQEDGSLTAEEKETPGEAFGNALDRMTGLRSVKEKLAVYERMVRFNSLRRDKGLPVTQQPLHAMFLGSSGTGKTTVAKIMGAMLHRAGVLSKGHVVVRERATLLGQNYNSESEKTLEAIGEAQGGILFIDEAYQLFQPDDPRDPGKFVIETLLTALADEDRRDWMLVLAGYPDEMKRMLDINPGFRSRIPVSNIYTFDDFTESELMEIAENYLADHRYVLSPESRTTLTRRISADYAHRGKNFGNARHIINLIQTEILPAMAVRVTASPQADETLLTEIHPSDIPSPFPIPSRPRLGFHP